MLYVLIALLVLAALYVLWYRYYSVDLIRMVDDEVDEAPIPAISSPRK